MQKPIADVFTWPSDDPVLIGGRCSNCQSTVFPFQGRCPRCGGSTMDEVTLPTRGSLVAWTTQDFPPVMPYAGSDNPKDFVPFGVGLVQLDDVIRVESRLTEADPTKLEFGSEVELEIIPFYIDENGDEVMTFAFAPVPKD